MIIICYCQQGRGIAESPFPLSSLQDLKSGDNVQTGET